MSKALTARVFRFYCGRAGASLGKFVVPNPFGPHEEPRYTAYVMKEWLKGGRPNCASPAYVRDNIHVTLLAKAYARFVSDLPAQAGYRQTNPSGYVESQGAFTLRLAQEMRPRLGLPCEVDLLHQSEFPEPRVRVNTDFLDVRELGWDEAAAWDGMAEYYRTLA
jgi:nucleoside-diphosphate-sugar epimerase